MKSKFDTPWKMVIERFFRELMEFFFPETFLKIDWSKPYEFLDNELLELDRQTRVGKKLSDKLIKVCRLDGSEAWVIIHIEVQGGWEAGFPERMFEYYYRIYDKYNRRVMGAAILTDTNRKWRPSRLYHETWGCELTFTFPIIKLIDYEFEFLDKSSNPLAKVVQAHLIALQTRGKPELRFAQKLFLVKKLYPMGYNEDDIRLLYTFMDYALRLPPNLDAEFLSNMKNYEEEINMPYISFAERQGISIGIPAGGRTILQAMIEKKFGEITPKTIQLLEKANTTELMQIGVRMLSANSIEELFSLADNEKASV